MQLRPITDNVAIADQPTEDDLAALRQEGYVGVVNLRHDGEPDQPLGVAAEGRNVQGHGMNYLHHGIGGAPLTEQGVKEVCDFLDAHSTGKVLVHCRKGGRAAALVLLHQARTHGWAPEEALARGDALGLKVEGNLRMMVQQYLDAHRGP